MASRSRAREVPYSYKQYGRRWLMLTIVFALNFVIQIIYITFAPIATLSAAFYRVSLTAINWLALVWALLFLPFTVVSAWALFKFGLRKCMIVAGVLMTAGSAVRLLSILGGTSATAPASAAAAAAAAPGAVALPDEKPSHGSFVALMAGTIVVAAAQPVVLSAPTLCASAWFSEKQRALANTMMLLANPLGLAVGALLSSSLATESRPQRVEVVLVIQAAAALACAAAALFLRAAPPSAPSGTAAYKRPGENLGRDLKSLHDNFGYLTLCNVFALAVGGFQALLTLLDQILQPAGYSSVDTGHISAVLILCGIVGAASVGPLLDSTRAYKLIMAISITLCFPFVVGFALLAQDSGKKNALLAVAAFIGFFGFPVLPTALDMSAEVTYPISAGVTSAILWCFSQVMTIILVVLVDGPLAEDSAEDGAPRNLEPGTWLIVGCIAAATFLSWIWSGRYVRWEAEATVRRLQQAQRRDAGLPFVDIIAEPGQHQQQGAENGAPRAPTPDINAAAVAAVNGGDGLGLGPLGVGHGRAAGEDASWPPMPAKDDVES